MGGGSRRGRGRGRGRSTNSGSGSGNPKTRKRGSVVREALFVEGGFLSDWSPSSSNRNSGSLSLSLSVWLLRNLRQKWSYFFSIKIRYSI